MDSCPIEKHIQMEDAMVSTTTANTMRTARLGLRATPRQEALLRQAAETANRSLTDFILDAACQAADQILLDQRMFLVSGHTYQALLDLLDEPETDNSGLTDLYAHQPPWATK
jgi:uncharacterized protein (DUF1778 family)